MKENAVQMRLAPAGPEHYPELLAVWEASVRATHHFLREEDIAALRPRVAEAFAAVELLLGAWDADGVCAGFMGIAAAKVERLFLAPQRRGRGLGRRLIAVAAARGAQYVDVNEQNESAVGFYRHLGFREIGRSLTDSDGRPFPIL